MDEQIQQMQHEFRQGVSFLERGMPDLALASFRKVRAMLPESAALYLYSGVALHELKRYPEAIECYRKLLLIEPESGVACNNMGNSLLELGQFEQAAEAFRTASSLLPDSPVPLTALATALLALSMVADAELCCRKALQLNPGFADAHWNLALCLLLQGNMRDGWPEYEWRWKRNRFTSPVRHSDRPLWDGSPLAGKTIVLHAEQGYGDAIQFVRYAPLVASRGGSVIIECHPQLAPLFRTVEGVQSVVPFDTPLPPFDVHAPLLSLPGIFETDIATIPASCPYLAVPDENRAEWAPRMAASPAGMRIGLVWAGKDYPDPLRSCRLSDMAVLGGDERVAFYSLQLGPGAEQALSPPPGMKLIDLTSHIHDFSDTAALVEQLDLVISIDTAVAHLAGALGKPVWLVLPYAADWRWLIERRDSPWYPRMSVFRQEVASEWSSVFSRVAVALSGYMNNKAP